MLGNIGMGELVVILGIVLLVFGPKRLPELASSVGKAVRVFKTSMKEEVPAEETAPK